MHQRRPCDRPQRHHRQLLLAREPGLPRAERAEWQHRVKLLQSNSIDPDTLDERARAVLNYLDPRDLTLMLKQP